MNSAKLFAVGVLLFSCVFLAKATANPPLVTLIQLIATPERYDGKLITVIGFLSLEPEGEALYLSDNDYKHQTPNRIRFERNKAVLREEEILDLNYVLVVGTFKAEPSGDGHAVIEWVGSVTKVTSCRLWSDMKHPRVDALRDQLKNQLR